MTADGKEMIALTRVSLDPAYTKTVGEPQDETKMAYDGLYTNFKPLVRRLDADFREWKRYSQFASDVLRDYERLVKRSNGNGK